MICQIFRHYIGHSQGTTSFFIMCSQRPEYNARTIHILAPIAFMGRLFSPFVIAAALFQNTIDVICYHTIVVYANWLRYQLQFGAGLFGIYEFLPNSEIMSLLGEAACRDQAWFQSMCSNVLFLIGGFNSEQMNSVSKLPLFL